jgi:hypothetical protein
MRKCEPSGSHFFYPAYLIELAAAEKALQRRNLPPTLHGGGQRVILARSQTTLVSRKWSFTSPTRRAPVQPARPTTCSRKARTSPATGAPGNGGLALLGSAWQASLLRRTGLLNTSSRPCDTNSLSKLDSKSTKFAVITGPSRRQSQSDRLGPAKPMPCYAFGFDNRRNEFRNVEKCSGRGVLLGAKACSTYKRCTTK